MANFALRTQFRHPAPPPQLHLGQSRSGSFVSPHGDPPSGLAVQVLQTALPIADASVLASAGFLFGHATGRFVPTVLPVLVATLLGSKFVAWNDGYRAQSLCDPARQLRLLAMACGVWFLTAFIASLTVPLNERTAAVDFGIAAGASFILLGGARTGLARTLRTWAKAGRLARKIAVVGLNDVSRALTQRLRTDPAANVRIVGVYRASPEDPDRLTQAGLLVRGGIDDLVRHTRDRQFDLVIVALPSAQIELVRDITQALASCACDVSIFSQSEALRLPGVRLEAVGSGVTLAVSPHPLAGRQGVQKAMFDRIVALLLLILLAPAFVLIMLAIRCDSAGPIFFRQVRFGLNNQRFQILKFRTMYNHLADPLAERQTSRNDDRVTRIGQWLRRTSLDELPQLLNVLAGDMSLVGPRPHAPGTRAGTRELEEVVDTYCLRHRVKPGITGLAQVNGCRGAIRTEEHLLKRVAYDISYIEQWSFLLDLKILLLTLVKGFVARNAF